MVVATSFPFVLCAVLGYKGKWGSLSSHASWAMSPDLWLTPSTNGRIHPAVMAPKNLAATAYIYVPSCKKSKLKTAKWQGNLCIIFVSFSYISIVSKFSTAIEILDSSSEENTAKTSPFTRQL